MTDQNANSKDTASSGQDPHPSALTSQDRSLTPIEREAQRSRGDVERSALGEPSGRLRTALRLIWAGAERHELQALLCEAWGPRPCNGGPASDLRGLAAREAGAFALGRAREAQAEDELASCAAGPRL